MARAENTELIDDFEEFYRNYYRNEIGELARQYPNEQRSLFIDWDDLYRFDSDLADDYRSQPGQLQEYAEEALRLYDLPVDVGLGRAHVRIRGLQENTEIREIRARHRGQLLSVQGTVQKATDVRPKITEAAFECQRCGTLTRIPQTGGDFQEPHECQGCERQGPFDINFDQSEFVDAQKIRVQESPEGLRGGETPQDIDVHIEDDITGKVTAGDHVRVTGVLHLDQQESGRESTAMFDVFMDGVSVEIEDEQFEDMDIDEADKRAIVDLSTADDIYEQMVASIAPSIYGYEQAKLAMTLQLFSGVAKHLPDGSRIRGDLHMLLIGDPGTGKCVKGDTSVTLADGSERPIRDVVESNLDAPTAIEDGVYDEVDLSLPTMGPDGTITEGRATKVWKREAPERMYRLRTTSGKEIEITPSHPLFVQSEGQFSATRASELHEGVFVATPRTVPTAGDDALDVDYRRSASPNAVRLDLPADWTPLLARLLGYVIAEGHVQLRDDHTGSVYITNNDPEIIADVAAAYDSLGVNYSVDEPRDGKSAERIRSSSGELVSFFETLEPAILERSAEQRVPDAVLRATAETKRAFLRAYVDAEGHVSTSQRELAIASMSRELLDGVQSLLVSVGVQSSIEPRNNGSYRVRISGAAFERYVERVGFVTDRKADAAHDFDDSPHNTNRDIVPDVGDELRRVREALALSQFECGVARTTYQHYERGDRNPSRDSLLTVVEAFEERIEWLRETKRRIETGGWEDIESVRDELNVSQTDLADEMGVEQTAVSYYERNDVVPDGGRTMAGKNAILERIASALDAVDSVARLRDLAENDVRWDRIVSIEELTPEYDWVYDLEVDDTHTYLSNGVVSHNSQLLQYIRQIAPRSVYTSGKGSSSAGLTASAVQDDFGEGQQWTLEAGALVLADQGIAAVDELDKMKCVTGDTLVHLGDRIARIRDIAHEAVRDGTIESLENGRSIRDVDLEAWTMTDDGRLVTRPVTAIHEYDAPQSLVEVSLSTGERLSATADHPYFVFEDGERVEKAAADVESGDWVYVPRSIEAPATDGGTLSQRGDSNAVRRSFSDETPGQDGVSPSLGRVLGYLAGDGNLYYQRDAGVYGIRFTNTEEELLADFERACEGAFDAETVRPPSERREDGVETVRLCGREYADVVLEAGMNLETYDGKRVPEGVTEASRAAKAAFVRAFADSEGNVDGRMVKLCSASHQLLLGVKHLLLEFGISCQIQHRVREGKRDIYLLVITDADSLAAFDRQIGFTLDRKQTALTETVETVSGDRTILDVLPDCGAVLETCRTSLRLHQSECGIDDATYCDFENGDADISFRLARVVLVAFEDRKRRASLALDELDSAGWDDLERIRTTFHVSQSGLAEGTGFSQQQVSRRWGEDEGMKETVADRLRSVLGSVADTDLSRFTQLVDGDVKWRRVETVETVPATVDDDRIRLLEEDLADVLGCSTDEARERARAFRTDDPSPAGWDELRTVLERYGISMTAAADDLGVDQATVSRWFNGHVSTDEFETVRDAVLDRADIVRSAAVRKLEEIEERERPSVYDLTVDGTHNFVANGMIVHNSDDRSAMHEALEQQTISISKAGINATLQSRCSLLGAANPKYGRFDQYESIGEQIDLEPALISRFDLIFTVTDDPDPDRDRELAEHILRTNYAGELNTQRTEQTAANVSQAEVDAVTDTVAPAIEPDLLRKYVAYAQRNCFPTMTEEAKEAISDFYVDLRAEGADEDAPIPVTARKLEALVRLAEASARVRLADTVEIEDAERVIEVVRTQLQDIGVDPETGEFDADIVETGTSKTQRDRIKNVKALIAEIEEEYDAGAPIEEVLDRAEETGTERSKAEHELEKLRRQGEVYEPQTDHLRTT
ncbi:LAGLIDADG family homing endonuclease [Halococcus salifodinae]|uniref:DNA helicase n=1 Tax=Halococcus salifodinae DSM 8989 TaxID=1227456 RepID=M0NAL9_9EURY|nr:LAGLIDADG family homing endonuclease [Halococcus salifodinae]EMA54921.1 replicative DNA helicase / cell division control protein 21 /MCM [Halococcus salifodinae DSM 8989]